MPEKDIDPEVSQLIEDGGLTPVHADELVRRIGWTWGRSIPSKVAAYYKPVAQGKLTDTIDARRSVLGRRHFEYIVSIDPRNPDLNSKLYPLSKPRVYFENPIAQQVHDWAALEEAEVYILDDYLYYVCNNYNGFRKEDTPHEDSSSTIPGDYLTYNRDHWEYIRYLVTIKYNDDLLMASVDKDPDEHIVPIWLLENEVKKPSRMSKEALGKKLKQIAIQNPERIRDRLKARTPELAHLHSSPYFGVPERRKR